MAKVVKKGKTKSVDTWKLKKKFEVIAPDIFNNTPIGPIFAKEAEDLTGRIVETTLSKLVNSNQHHIKVTLVVIGTQGFNALTSIRSVELSRAYISAQANPGSDIIEHIFKTKTKDGKDIRIKTIMFTRGKIASGKKTLLRKTAEEIGTEIATKSDYAQVVQEVVFGKIGSLIFNKAKKLVPVGRVEVRKLELL